LGFGPFGGSDAGGQEAWVGFAGVECSLTAGTDDRWCGVGLTAEELREQFLGEHFPELVEEVFNGREGSSPGRSRGTVELGGEIFGDAFQIRSGVFDLGRSECETRHLEALGGVATERVEEFPPPSVKEGERSCK
jgi:hypothetical protein